MLVGGKVWESLTESLHRRLEKNNSREVRHGKAHPGTQPVATLNGLLPWSGFPNFPLARVISAKVP
jgi:hypothetical protein